VLRRSSPRSQAAPPSRNPLLFIFVGVIALAGLLFPVRSVKHVDVELATLPKAEPKTPAGVFAELKVPTGSRVDAGAVLARLDVGWPKTQRDDLVKTAALLDAAAARALAKTNAALVKRARLAVTKANQDLAKAKALAARHRDERAELDVAHKEAALEKATRLLENADGNEKAKELKTEAATAREQAAALQKKIDHAAITAPAAGIFEVDGVPPAGAQFDDGTPFGRIVDLVLLLKGAPVDAGDAVLVQGDRRVPIFTVDKRPEGLTVPFENGVTPGPAVLEIARGYRPWPIALLTR
jgi:hypothetical protein